MSSIRLRHCAGIKREILLPGDKSIAHRAAILSAISSGKTVISNFPNNNDCMQTLKALELLGVRISCVPESDGALKVVVFGRRLHGLRKPCAKVYCAESGTTFRLLAGLLSGQAFESRLSCAASLARRPMYRITRPLRLMGARVSGKASARKGSAEEYPPLSLMPSVLKGISYTPEVASAQVKSAILLAGLYAQGRTEVKEPLKTRDHTERMLKLFGSRVTVKGGRVSINGGPALASPGQIRIPGDISSAAFFIVLGLILKDSVLTVRGVGLNPLRSGLINALRRMGADIRICGNNNGFEPSGDITARSSSLRGIRVKSKEIPSLIDELPVLMVAASFARGRSVFEGVGELRFKETDRIRSMSDNLKKLGAKIRVIKHGRREDIEILGSLPLKGAIVNGSGDHRTAMSLAVAGLAASGQTVVLDASCINKSFPGFRPLISSFRG